MYLICSPELSQTRGERIHDIYTDINAKIVGYLTDSIAAHHGYNINLPVTQDKANPHPADLPE